MNDAVKLALGARPSERQLEWYRTGLYCLISFGIPTFNGKQYGDGFAPATMFGPENEDMSTDEWADFAVKGGMNGFLLNVKQCDGFCLWPTAHTDYSVKASNWLDGQGDLVKMCADSCKKYGLKFGIQLSIWDRHDKRYGKGEEYDEYVLGLLRELLTDYGDIFYVRLDPTIGAEERRNQKCDWGKYYALIRELQPDAVIGFRGPDVRWCGNERGAFREAEWSSLPAYLGVYEDGSEAKPETKKPKSLMTEDIGSEKAIKGEKEFIWYPTEIAFPMRPVWYFNEDDKYAVKTKDKLLKAYYGSAGNNGCMLLGLAPDRQGKFADADGQILVAFGHDLKCYFGYNLLKKEMFITASSEMDKKHTALNVCADDDEFWMPFADDRKPELIIDNPTEEPFDKIVIQENIADGQAIAAFEIYKEEKPGKWKKVYDGQTVGYRKICAFAATKAKKIKIRFTDFRKIPEIRYIAIN